MGQEILYCDACATQLRGHDFERRAAFRSEGRVFCRSCVPPDVLAAADTATDEPPASSSSSRHAAPSKSTRRLFPVRGAGTSTGPLVAGATAGAVLLLLLLIAGLSSGGPRPRPAAPAGPAPTPPQARAPSPPPVPPSPPPRAVERPAPPPPPPPAPARVERPAPPPRTVAEDLAELDAELAGYRQKNRPESALLVLDAALKRRPESDWAPEIERRLREFRSAPKPAPSPPPAESRPAPRPPADPAAGPVAAWSLRGGSGPRADDAAGKFPGTLQGGAAWSDWPPALRLDGKSGHVALGRRLDVLRGAPACTVAAWILPETIVVAKNDRDVILGLSTADGGRNGHDSRLTLELVEGDEVRFQARDVDGPAISRAVTTSKAVVPGKWHHVAGVVDFGARSIRIYVNGAEAAAKATPAFSAAGALPDTPVGVGAIGSEDDGTAGYFHGLIADVRLYERALSPAELAALAASAPPAPGSPRPAKPAPGLLALYAFREGKGAVVRDVSGVGEPLDLEIADPGAVRWASPRGLLLSSPTILKSAGPASKIAAACRASRELTVEAWVKPIVDAQSGPARIVTLSADTTARNFTLGHQSQAGSSPFFDLRLRSTSTTTNGLPSLSTPPGSAGARPVHLAATRSASGLVRFYLDGVERATATARGDFSNWDAGYRLALGNEFTLDRPWLGELRLVAVYSRALAPDEVARDAKTPP